MGKKYLDTKEDSLESSILAVWQEAAKKQEKLDPVGKEDDDVDNDGDVDSSDKYLAKRRKAISKAIKKDEGAMKRGKDLDTFKPKPKKEEVELEENIMSTPGKDDYIVLIQGPGDNNQKIIQVFKGKSQLNKAKKARDDWNTKNADKIKKNKKGKPISAHMARLYMHPATSTLNGKPDIPKVGNKVMWSTFNNRIIKEGELDEIAPAVAAIGGAMAAKALSDRKHLAAGKMSQLHQLMKDGKTAEEIAKIMRVDAKTIKKLMGESYEIGTDEYRKHTEDVTPGEDGEWTKHINQKSQSMREALAQVWDVNEGSNPFAKKALTKEVKDGKTMTGKKIAAVDINPTIKEKTK